MSMCRRLLFTVSLAFVVAIAAGLAVRSSSSVEGDALSSGFGNFDSSSLAVAPATIKDLGRLLFYDKRLSGDGSTSCATCHDPNNAFADGKPLSDDSVAATCTSARCRYTTGMAGSLRATSRPWYKITSPKPTS